MQVISTTSAEKLAKLRRAKFFATGLLILVTVIFLSTRVISHYFPWQGWGFILAFAEASMVGALADWFAVVALFRHPMGIPIPHTNLVAKNQTNLGKNMGNFVRDNFLSENMLKDKIAYLKLSATLIQWLEKEENLGMISKQLAKLIPQIIQNLDEEQIKGFIQKNSQNLVQKIDLAKTGSDLIHYFIEKNQHQVLLGEVLKLANQYLEKNEKLIYEKVRESSFSFIPQFVDDFIAQKIVQAVEKTIDEIEEKSDHSVRLQFDKFAETWMVKLREEETYQNKAEKIKQEIVQRLNLENQAQNLWETLKTEILRDFEKQDSQIHKYIHQSLDNLAEKLFHDQKLQDNIDNWIRDKILQIALQNQNWISEHISQTVRNWNQGDLSDKLELAIGKDLQYIRINGTLVGGTVGLILYLVFEIWLF
jgi:uncharacterized membrane-anchored protein YjiN (DUF445 family)